MNIDDVRFTTAKWILNTEARYAKPMNLYFKHFSKPMTTRSIFFHTTRVL